MDNKLNEVIKKATDKAIEQISRKLSDKARNEKAVTCIHDYTEKFTMLKYGEFERCIYCGKLCKIIKIEIDEII